MGGLGEAAAARDSCGRPEPPKLPLTTKRPSPSPPTCWAVPEIMPLIVASAQGPARSCAQRAAAPLLKRSSCHMRLVEWGAERGRSGGLGKLPGGGAQLGKSALHREYYSLHAGNQPSSQPPRPIRTHLPTPSPAASHRYQRLMPSEGSITQRSWSAQIMKRHPSGEMALPPAWPARGGVGGWVAGRGVCREVLVEGDA